MGVEVDIWGAGCPLVVTTVPGDPLAEAELPGVVAAVPGAWSGVLENLRSSQASCSAENSGLSVEPPSSVSAMLSTLSGGGANTTETTQEQGDKQAACCSALFQQGDNTACCSALVQLLG